MTMLATDDRTAVEIVGGYLDSAPVDVHAIARDLGLDLVSDRHMGEDSGKIERNRTAPGGYRITVNGHQRW